MSFFVPSAPAVVDPGPGPAPDSGIGARVGARIRDLRVGRALTLEELAHRAGVSRAMLSRIERGESSPTAQLLDRVCGGLGLTLSALFTEAAAGRAAPLARLADQPSWRDPGSGYRRRDVSPPRTGSAVEITVVDFPAGARVFLDGARPPGTDQHVWLLEGALELELAPGTVRLDAGDCYWMRLGQPVAFHNPGDRPARYAVVIGHAGARA